MMVMRRVRNSRYSPGWEGCEKVKQGILHCWMCSPLYRVHGGDLCNTDARRYRIALE